MGYLSQIKSGGKQYIYLTEYCGSQTYSTKKEQRVFGFGEARKALLQMKRWRRRYEKEFPNELIELGYTFEDLSQWIKTLETGITPKGRSFDVNIKKRAVN